MLNVQPLDFAINEKFAKIRFPNQAFGKINITLAALLTGGNILCDPIFGPTAPINFKLPQLPRSAEYFEFRYNYLSVDALANTVLGGNTFVRNDLKATIFSNGVGANPILYDGQARDDFFLISGNKSLSKKILKLSELREVSMTNFAASVAHVMTDYQTTTAFAPDTVGATNGLIVGLELDIYAWF